MSHISSEQPLRQYRVLQHLRLNPVPALSGVRLLASAASEGIAPWAIGGVSEPINQRLGYAEVSPGAHLGHNPRSRQVRTADAFRSITNIRCFATSFTVSSTLTRVWTPWRGSDCFDRLCAPSLVLRAKANRAHLDRLTGMLGDDNMFSCAVVDSDPRPFEPSRIQCCLDPLLLAGPS